MLGDIGQPEPIRCGGGELPPHRVVVHGRTLPACLPAPAAHRGADDPDAHAEAPTFGYRLIADELAEPRRTLMTPVSGSASPSTCPRTSRMYPTSSSLSFVDQGEVIGWSTTLRLACERVHAEFLRDHGPNGGPIASWGATKEDP